MSETPANLRFTKTHEWVQNNGDGTFTVGITDHAQAALGDIVFVEVPETELPVLVDEAVAVVESVKAASDIYAPLGGKIVTGNQALADTPDLINSSPYQDGWIFRIESADASTFDGLLDATAYEKLVQDEG